MIKMMVDYLIVVNFISGPDRAKKAEEKVAKALAKKNLSFEKLYVKKRLPFGKVVAKNGLDIKSVQKAIIAIGGDGTLNEIVSFLTNNKLKLPIAIVPCGSANLLAKQLNIPLNLSEAVKNIFSVKQKAIDLGKIITDTKTYYFLFGAGLGFDVAFLKETTRVLKKKLGIFAYFKAIFRSLFSKKRPKKTTLKIGNQVLKEKADLILFLNGGNLLKATLGLDVGPEIRVDDGKMDIYLFRIRNPFDFLISFLLLFFNKGPLKKVKHFKTKKVKVFCKPNTFFQVDGDIVGKTPFSAQILPKAATFVVP